jgi:hypothetical protein
MILDKKLRIAVTARDRIIEYLKTIHNIAHALSVANAVKNVNVMTKNDVEVIVEKAMVNQREGKTGKNNHRSRESGGGYSVFVHPKKKDPPKSQEKTANETHSEKMDGENFFTIEDIEKQIRKKIKPSEIGISVIHMRGIHNKKKLLIRCPTKEDATLLAKIVNEKLDMLCQAEVVNKKKPRLILQGLVADYEESEIANDIYLQNKQLKCVGVKQSDIRLIRTIPSKRKPDIKNVIVEMTPTARRCLLEKEYIYVGFQRIPVKDADPTIRCFHCLQLGHASMSCLRKMNPPTCSHCGSGHRFDACDKKDKPPECANCVREKIKTDKDISVGHNAMDNKLCSYYENSYKQAMSKVEY